MRILSAAAFGVALIVAAPALAQHGDDHGRHGHDDRGRGGDHHRGDDHGRGDWHGGRDGHFDNGWHGRSHGGWHGGRPNRGGPDRRFAYNRGYRFDRGYHGWSRYDGLPPAFRHRYRYNPHYRYVYRDDVVYVVDPTTRLVRDVVDLLSY